MTEPSKEKNITRISGLPGGSEAWWLLQNRRAHPRWLVLAATDEAAQNLFDDFQALERWQTPAAPSEAAYFSEEEEDVRTAALSAWSRSGPEAARFLFSSWESAQRGLPVPDDFRTGHVALRIGDKKDRSAFLLHLSQQSYSRVDSVEQVGEMAVRGEVVDLWSPGWDGPMRFLWPFDQVESIRKIDLATQRSTDAVETVLVR
ncbi:MAG TPA: hypothetical protein P5079_11355, partial [Elusimicrobiota bacterium]|nr:hypothetical protein [Elusimicrobiota bacterium]